VHLEPAFTPFGGHAVESGPINDDARKPTFLSSLWDRLARPRQTDSASSAEASVETAAPREERDPGPVSEVEIVIPFDQKVPAASTEAWLRTVAATAGRISFELVGSDGTVSFRIAAREADAKLIVGQLRSFFPAIHTRVPERLLGDYWDDAESSDSIVAVEFALGREFMLPLRVPDGGPDPLIPIIGALGEVSRGDVAVLQILFEEARAPWAAHALWAVTAPDGEPFFLDAPQITDLAKEKCAAPLYAVAIRLAARGRDESAVVSLLRNLGGALAQFGSPERNELVPLAAEDIGDLVDDVLTRRTHRSGMIVSLPELSALVRLPGHEVRSPVVIRMPEPTTLLPEEVLGKNGIVLGEAMNRGVRTTVRLSPDARLKHLHVIGASGTGKSTLLEQLILQDIESGAGVGLLDPHGDLVDNVLARVPEERADDVVIFDPADPDYVIGWNILAARSQAEKEILSSDLVAVFRRLSTSWGDQMSTVLGNTVLAFLESDKGGTLLDLRRFLLDDSFRDDFLKTVRDQHVVSFWKEEYRLLVGKRPQAPILTRLDTFLRSRLVREVVTERERVIDFREIIDSGKIFLAKLSQGAIGEENAALLGSLLVSGFHQASLARQDTALDKRRPFYLCIDEFQEVATPSMGSLFSGVRKYRLGLTVAHQDLYQLHANAPEVERSVLANAHTRIAFRLSDEDARKFEKGFGGFVADDLLNLRLGEAICRTGRKEDAFRLFTKELPQVSEEEAEERRRRLRIRSMTRYARLRRGEQSDPIPKPGIPGPPPSETEAPVVAASSVPSRPKPVDSQPKPIKPNQKLPGRGGPQHKYIQSLLKRAGEDRGFRATLEKTVLGGHGHVDVVLERDGLSIGCEISITTSTEHELSNVSKCLAAGFDYVVLVSSEKAVLTAARELMTNELADGRVERLHFLTPEGFILFLDELEAETKGSTKSVRGYRVNVEYRSLSVDERKSREGVLADVVAKSLRRMGKVK
jgi:hypothetical protein